MKKATALGVEQDKHIKPVISNVSLSAIAETKRSVIIIVHSECEKCNVPWINAN